MRNSKSILALSVVILAGCASSGQLLDSSQPAAIQAALERGRFDLSCPGAQGDVLSRELIEPPMDGPYVGVLRAEYTVGVEGCDQRKTYIVVCAEGGDGCVAANSN
ncbi:hypothetical protein G3480_16740 [Thiorhodococcus mannitoliphagus]|uniref:Lipoprotein n=1 Tax=Thiorhodococcus mannitoliphagus TaxID=329406 RepID=A0A6P1E0G2_9GAMM|nr:hypothetical protein [Thiorhodococcus mannitoliphagus]NEX21932.1 hypothetical protein [Thiorhodococcus mannitoliphagus]